MSEEEYIETPYLSEEIQLTKVTPLRVIWAMFKLTSWQNFAHHPTCSVYKNHYFSIGRIKLCVGCTSFYSMIGAALIVFFAANEFFENNPIILPIVYLYGIGGLALHIFFRPKNKWLKAFFRASFGLGIGAYITIIILGPTWWLRLILIGFIPFELALFFIIRGPRANLELCETCALHTADPPCDPMKNTELKSKKLNAMIDKQIEGLQRYKQTKKEFEQQEEEESSALEEKD